MSLDLRGEVRRLRAALHKVREDLLEGAETLDITDYLYEVLGLADETALDAAVEHVRETFGALSKARTKLERCRRPDSREKARVEMVAAEAAYREAATVRDELVKKRNNAKEAAAEEECVCGDGRDEHDEDGAGQCTACDECIEYEGGAL